MDFDVPTDLINRSQIGFREGAGLSSFNPNDTTLPSLPTIEASISTLDPSPPYLRCKFCQGKLLRGLQSLICIYCGEYQKRDLHPDPISFNSTNGYSWLLRSLNLNGSERVGSLAEGSGFHGGQSPAEDLVTISELLDLQISWRDEPKKPEISITSKTTELSSPLNLGTTNLDNFFTERITSDAKEEQQVSSKHDQTQAFGDQENLNLFPNAFPPETPVTSSIDDSSDWNAEFQFADSKVENENPKPVDHVVVPEPDLSAHMDAFFGQMESSSNKKPNEDNWIQDDLFANMGPSTFQQSEQLESVVEQKDDLSLSDQLNDPSSKDVDQDWFSDGNWQKSSDEKHDISQDKDKPYVSSTEDWFENANWQKSSGDKKDDNLFDFKPEIDAVSSPSLVNDLKVDSKSSDFDNLKKQELETTDWFQDSQWSTGASNVTTNMEVKKDDEEFDDWNDFTSSTGNQDSLQDSWKQSSIENTDGSKKIQEINLFSSTDDPQEMDLFSGFKNPNDAQVDMFSESSTSNRNVNVEGGHEHNTPNAITTQENDVQMLLSQMHDLSFMLKSELSIPSKPTNDDGPSHS